MVDNETPLRDVVFVAFDTETTGTGAGTRILELAGSRFRGDQLLGTFESLVDPEMPIPPESTAIHSITDDMVRGKPKADEAIARFAEFAEGAVLAAHNASFDAGMIGLELARARRPAPGNPILDSLKAARRVYPGTSHSLDTLIDLAGLPRQDARHRALGDAELVRHLIARLADAIGGRDASYARLLELAGPAETFEQYLPPQPRLPFALTLLEEACRTQTKVNLHLDSGGTRTQQRIVSPRLLYSWYGTDYLEAFCTDEGALRCFRLDKVIKAEPGASSGFLF